MSTSTDSSSKLSGSTIGGSSNGASVSSGGRGHHHWKTFRKEMLAPHHIRILDSFPGDELPEKVIKHIECNHNNTLRFVKQRDEFRRQVALGHGFGDSTLFPHEVLPWNRSHPFIARCMVPAFSTDPLPEMRLGPGPRKPTLAPPRPSFACGFSESAFAPEELSLLPGYFATSGTALQFEKGLITSDFALYCPFLTFERAFVQQHAGLEVAANQCAVNGAWCVRSLQMLHAKAMGDAAKKAFAEPVSFSCAIDNTVAIINYHWVDHAQTYCMAPIVRFDLSRNDHFNQLLVWVDAIGHWATTHVLPEIKKAISLLADTTSDPENMQMTLRPVQHPNFQEEQNLVSALQLTYANVPWQFDHHDASAVSSSTASWGSPMISEAVFSKFKYPLVPPPRVPPPPGSVCSEPAAFRTYDFSGEMNRASKPGLDLAIPGAPRLEKDESKLPLVTGAPPPSPPSFEQNTELLLKKRLSHAMDEIKDLHVQLTDLKQEITGSTSCLQSEVLGLRKSMSSVIRREQLSFKQGSVRRAEGSTSMVQSAQRVEFAKDVSVITTPTDPIARAPWSRPNTPRTPSGLKHVLSLDTNFSASSMSTKTTSGAATDSNEDTENCDSPITIFSPTIINMVEDKRISEQCSDGDTSVSVAPQSQGMWATVFTSHALCLLMPSALFRILLLGLMLDYCMQSLSAERPTSLSYYLGEILQNTVIH